MRRMAIAPNLASVCKYTWVVYEVWNISITFRSNIPLDPCPRIHTFNIVFALL